MRRYPAVLPLLLTIGLFGMAGCSAQAPSPRPARASTDSPRASGNPTGEAPGSTSAAPAATIVLGPAMRLTLDRRGPMVASDAGPAGRHWVLPAAAARDRDGGFVLFIVWFGDEPGDQIVTVARSDDGRAWQTGKEPVLTDLGMELVNPGAIPSAALELEDGTWRLFGWAAHAADSNRFTTWSASAPAPEGPWTLVAERAIDAGQPGAWDSAMAEAGAVLPTNDGFALWYEGEGAGTSVRGDIGLATSSDGVAWHKAGDPVIRRGICGPGTAAAVEQPQVERWSGGFVAAVGAAGVGERGMSVFGVTSPDARTWSCGSADPLLRAEDIPGGQGIHTIASVPLDGNRFELIIESLLDGRSELWSAIVEVGG